MLAAAADCGAAAIHPGYGFLAENAGFAADAIGAGLTWVGPPPEAITQMGDKINARNLMTAADVPVAAGSTEPVADVTAALAEAERIGYPVMIKAAAGGGGIGMSAAAGPEQLRAGFETARSRAERFFASPAILLERFLAAARHVEVQILGPGRRHGRRARRAGLLGAAPPPEGGGGDAVARRAPGAARADAGRGGAGRRGGRLPRARAPSSSSSTSPRRSSCSWR